VFSRWSERVDKRNKRPSRPKRRGVEPGSYNIKEVAEAARTSVATVSRALRHADVVAPKTRRRVLEAVERLGYTPSAQPSMLRSARTHVIVALVPDIANPFFSEVIRGIEGVARQNGYSVLLGDTQHDPAREAEYWRLVASRQADGIISLLPRGKQFIRGAPIPFVNSCEYVKDPGVTSVLVDNVAAAHTAITYLLSLGHRQIACIAGPRQTQICIDRQSGYERALSDGGVRPNPRLVEVGDFSVGSGIAGVERLLSTGAKFTAVFCANDEMAFGAILALKRAGRVVPRDVSVVGFDDIQLAQYYDPALTTISQPKSLLGSEAMSLLLKALEGGHVRPHKRVLPTQLVVRDSTGPAPRT
jgi:LacI family transcriptional regulator, repressor for deo operon, udp, cdd, tsx, nupC, and nupG